MQINWNKVKEEYNNRLDKLDYYICHHSAEFRRWYRPALSYEEIRALAAEFLESVIPDTAVSVVEDDPDHCGDSDADGDYRTGNSLFVYARSTQEALTVRNMFLDWCIQRQTEIK